MIKYTIWEVLLKQVHLVQFFDQSVLGTKINSTSSTQATLSRGAWLDSKGKHDNTLQQRSNMSFSSNVLKTCLFATIFPKHLNNYVQKVTGV